MPPPPGFFFLLLFSLSPNFPRKTPPRYMPCLAARLLRFQGLSITQPNQLHKHRSFHNLFSSARPPFHEKTKQKQDPELFQGCHLSVPQITCENKSRGTVPSWNQGIPDYCCPLAATLSQETCVHARTHTHKIPRSELLPTVPGWDIPHIKELLPEMTVIPKSAPIIPLYRPLWDALRRTIQGMYFSSPRKW